MHWITKQATRPPKAGDKRTIKVFAFLPKKCDDGTTRWLEYVDAEQEFWVYSGDYIPPFQDAIWFPMRIWQTNAYKSRK